MAICIRSSSSFRARGMEIFGGGFGVRSLGSQAIGIDIVIQCNTSSYIISLISCYHVISYRQVEVSEGTGNPYQGQDSARCCG